jgi:hypothetical protein
MNEETLVAGTKKRLPIMQILNRVLNEFHAAITYKGFVIFRQQDHNKSPGSDKIPTEMT